MGGTASPTAFCLKALYQSNPLHIGVFGELGVSNLKDFTAYLPRHIPDSPPSDDISYFVQRIDSGTLRGLSAMDSLGPAETNLTS